MVQLHEIRADFHSEDDPVDASSARFHEKNPEDSGLTVKILIFSLTLMTSSYNSQRSIVVDTIRKKFADAIAINNISFVAYEKQILWYLTL